MKEPSTPQASYDGSLKELAKAHIGLVWALVYVLTVPVGLLGGYGSLPISFMVFITDGAWMNR